MHSHYPSYTTHRRVPPSPSIRFNSPLWRLPLPRFAFDSFQTSRAHTRARERETPSKFSLKQPLHVSIPVSFTPPSPFPTQTSRETRVQPPPVGSPPRLRPRQPHRRVRNSFASLGCTRRRTRRTRRRILLTRRTRTALLLSAFPGPPLSFVPRRRRARAVPSAVSFDFGHSECSIHHPQPKKGGYIV